MPTIIFQKLFSTCTVPTSWKVAKVLLKYKSGDKHDLTNYQQTSLTSQCSKLLEHIVYKHIATFMDASNILSNFQHGFHSGLSTVTQLTEFAYDINYSLDLANQVYAIFIYFSKAFDMVVHSKLFCKLSTTLNNPNLVKWL